MVRTYLFLVAFFAVALAGAFFLMNFVKLPPELPWFYSLPWGEAMLIPKGWFGAGLLFLLAVDGINFFIAKKTSRSDKVVAMVVSAATFLLTAIYLASFFRVLAIMA